MCGHRRVAEDSQDRIVVVLIIRVFRRNTDGCEGTTRNDNRVVDYSSSPMSAIYGFVFKRDGAGAGSWDRWESERICAVGEFHGSILSAACEYSSGVSYDDCGPLHVPGIGYCSDIALAIGWNGDNHGVRRHYGSFVADVLEVTKSETLMIE